MRGEVPRCQGYRARLAVLWGWLPFWPDIKRLASRSCGARTSGDSCRSPSASRSRSAPRRSGSARTTAKHPVDARRHPRREVVQGDLRAPANLNTRDSDPGSATGRPRTAGPRSGTSRPAPASSSHLASVRSVPARATGCSSLLHRHRFALQPGIGTGEVRLHDGKRGNANDSIGPAVHSRLLAQPDPQPGR